MKNEHRIEIRDFGPIRGLDMPVDPFMLFIGPQASGKSYTAKSIYFFKSLREDLFKYVMFELQSGEERSDPLKEFTRLVKEKFVDFWGSTFHLENIYLKYHYSSDMWIKIDLEEEKKFINVHFSESIIESFRELVHWARVQPPDIFQPQMKNLTNGEIIRAENERNVFMRELQDRINTLFNEKNELLFIPAGRSLLTGLTGHMISKLSGRMELSERIEEDDSKEIDFLMRVFLKKVTAVRNIFKDTLDNIILQKKELSNAPVDLEKAALARKLMRDILKSEYRNERGDERLYIDDHRCTKINFSSSGQQESLWILNMVFLLLLENQRTFTVVEEPETHLFPVAQLQIAQLLTLFHNQGHGLIVTTHSPYMLSAFGNLIYAHKVGNRFPDEAQSVLQRDFWLNSNDCSMHFIRDGVPESIMESDIEALKVEMIDEASRINADQFEQLFKANNYEL